MRNPIREVVDSYLYLNYSIEKCSFPLRLLHALCI
jgi:hypothetical protein